MKGEAIEMKLRVRDGLRWIGTPQRLGAWRRKPLELADARIGALEDGHGLEFLAQNADAGFRYA